MKISNGTFLTNYLDLWQKAKKRNDAKAQYELARLMPIGNSMSSAQKAFALYKKSAKQGFTDSQYALGVCYENGFGVKKSYPSAIRWYKQANDNITDDIMNNPDPVGEAENALVKTYFNNEQFAEYINTLLDLDDEMQEESFESDLYAAEHGDADAQNSVGHHYYYGHGVERSFEKAVYWYRKSANQGCEAGIIHLAECCEESRHFREAAKWYRIYAEIRIKWRNERLGW